MKKTFVWLLASLLFTMVGCVEGLHESGMTETSSEQLPDLTAGFAEGETRTYVESGKYLRWHEDDRLTAFYGNTRNRQYKFNGATGDNSGSFSYVSSGNLETGNVLDRIYAVYPYDETTTITDDGKISLTLPAVQTYAENSFGRGANTMLAVTENLEDTFLGFKNVCGYLKLKLYNADGATIKSIVVKGNGEEKIAGAATATVAFGEAPQLTMSDNATTAITIDCGDGVALGTTAEAATEFWVVIPETTFEDGITITITDTEGGIFEKSTTKEVVIERNAIQPMAALEVVCIKRLPKNNKIWYTATAKVEPNDKTVFGARYQSNEWNSATGEGVITFDNEITTIGYCAFYNCSSLTSVTIPDSVTAIGDGAFFGCSSLTSITIPNSVTVIGDSAFVDCCTLTSITIPDSVTTIGQHAFDGCSSLTSVTIPDSVTVIGYRAFSYCSSLTSVTIPDGVTVIGDGAFDGCSSLTSITIPDSVTVIGDSAFLGCGSLTSITIPDSVTTIGDYAFDGCNSLISITIPDSVTVIGDGAFCYCNSLQEFRGKFASDDGRCLVIEGVFNSFAPAGITGYTIPDGVTAIGGSAFSGCRSLTSITIPDGVTAIGDCAFFYCRSLTSITIPDSATTIGQQAFSGCISLTSITIPDSVTTIGAYAFDGCSGLRSIYCKPITPPAGDFEMFNTYSSIKIYVPTESVEAYKSASYWKDYASKIVGYDF